MVFAFTVMKAATAAYDGLAFWHDTLASSLEHDPGGSSDEMLAEAVAY
jgi:hypothetical protein